MVLGYAFARCGRWSILPCPLVLVPIDTERTIKKYDNHVSEDRIWLELLYYVNYLIIPQPNFSLL